MYAIGMATPRRKRTVPPTKLAREILRIRRSLGITMQEAADKIEYSLATWKAWEAGVTVPSKRAWKSIQSLKSGL